MSLGYQKIVVLLPPPFLLLLLFVFFAFSYVFGVGNSISWRAEEKLYQPQLSKHHDETMNTTTRHLSFDFSVTCYHVPRPTLVCLMRRVVN